MSPQTSEIIKHAEEEFSAWRANRKHREAIPDHLWSLAFEVAKQIGDSKACVLLRLNHARFKEKCHPKQEPTRKKQEFVEVPAPRISNSLGEAVLELESRAGKVSICLSGVDVEDVIRVTQSLLTVQ